MDLAENSAGRLEWARRFLGSAAAPSLALLAVLLALATLLVLYAAPVLNTPLAWLGLPLVLLAPGFLLTGILWPHVSPLALTHWPVWFVLSLAALGPPASALQLLGADWFTFELAWLLMLWVLGAVFAWRVASQPLVPRRLSIRQLLPAACLLGLCALVAWVVAHGPRDSDDWTYLGVVRQFIEQSQFELVFAYELRYTLRYTFHAWLFMQAFVVRLFGLDSITLVREVLPVLLAPLSLISFYGWAREFTGRTRYALIAVFIQLAIYLTFAQADGWGRGFFARAAQDKFLVWLIVLPLAFTFLWRYLAHARRADLVAYGLVLVTGLWVHPIGLFLGLVAVAGFALANLLLGARYQSAEDTELLPRRRWLQLGLVSLPVLAVPVLVHAITPTAIFDVTSSDVASSLRLAAGRLLFQPPLYISDPNLISHPLFLFALGLVPLLTPRLAHDRRAQFLVGSTVLPLALLFNPYTAFLLGQSITPWQLWRLTWVLPVALVLMMLLVSGLQAASRGIRFSPLKIAYVALALVVALALSDVDAARSLANLQKPHDFDPRSEEMLRALPSLIDRPSFVVVPRPMTRQLPAFSARALPLSQVAFAPEDPLGAEIDRFYQTPVDSAWTRQFLDFYRVAYIVVPVNSERVRELGALPERFAERFRTSRYMLFEVINH